MTKEVEYRKPWWCLINWWPTSCSLSHWCRHWNTKTDLQWRTSKTSQDRIIQFPFHNVKLYLNSVKSLLPFVKGQGHHKIVSEMVSEYYPSSYDYPYWSGRSLLLFSQRSRSQWPRVPWFLNNNWSSIHLVFTTINHLIFYCFVKSQIDFRRSRYQQHSIIN
jgi:hypothetical protein